MTKIYKLKNKKISDKYITGLSKIFDDRLFYVYHIDHNSFKFKVAFRRLFWGRTFFEWVFDEDFYITIGEGEIKRLEKNGIYYLELNMSLAPVLKIVLLVAIAGGAILPVYPKAVAFIIPLMFASPLLIAWIFAKYSAKSRIKLICNTA